MRDSMIFYRSYYEAIKDLPDDQFSACARAILEYALDDIEPEPGGIAGVVYAMAKPQIDKNNVRYQNGKKGGRPKTEAEPNNNQIKTKPKPKVENVKPNVNVNVNDNVNDNENVNVNVNVDDKEKDKRESNLKVTREKFKPPTLGEVTDYCIEKGYTWNPEEFCDFYQSKNWFVGKNKMVDWKAAARNWNRNNTNKGTNKTSAYIEAIKNRVKVVDDF